MGRAPTPADPPGDQALIRVIVTPGCPTGVGPELALRAATELRDEDLSFMLAGDDSLWRDGARIAGISLADFERIEPGEADRIHGGGEVVAAITAAVRLTTEGHADAICTAPIDKAELQAIGFEFPGHTEFLAHLAGDLRPLMVLAGPRLRVGLLTTHVALRQVPDLLNTHDTLAAIRIAAHFLSRDLGIFKPRIAMAGLNPHAGERGSFGDEEIRILAPAAEQARALGIDVSDPLPADTVFVQALRGRWDLVLAPTHDQALVAIKTAHFGEAVNITAGLPFCRTSPDHGTAKDLFGTGRADPSSMRLALREAAQLASNRLSNPT